MENPATWKRAENVIFDAYQAWLPLNDAGVSGLISLPAHIATALRFAGVLKDDDEPAEGASYVKWGT